MLIIDGSFGEGGGQIVRSSLTLAVLAGEPLTLHNIRARRSPPGLRRQHLTAAQAIAHICRGKLTGADVGSSTLTLEPGPVTGGDYTFDVGSAGSTSLVLQTLLPPLWFAPQPSTLTIIGGTHNTMAPPIEFLSSVYLPIIERMGVRTSLQLERHGFYPAGGGRVRAVIHPSGPLSGLELLERGTIVRRHVRALVARLPRHIAERECDVIRQASGWPDESFEIVEINDSAGPGNIVLIELASHEARELLAGFGQKGVRAERVAQSAWREAERYLRADVPVGVHLADQLLLPMGIAAQHGRTSSMRTLELTDHWHTHAQLLREMLHVRVENEPQADGSQLVRVMPRPR